MTTPATLHWGFSSLGAPEMGLPELADLGARYGCPNLELRTLNGELDLPAVLQKLYGGPEKVRELLAEKGAQVVCLNNSFKLTESIEKDRPAIEAFARWADELNAPFIRVFGGGKWSDTPTAEQWERASANLQWWLSHKANAAHRCDLILETHDAFSGNRQCLELFEKLGHRIPVIWDAHHTWKLAGEAPADSWQLLGPLVRHVHIKDSVSRPSERHAYTYVHLGEGEMPWREVLAILERERYPGVVSLEWEKLWHPYLPPLEEALRTARANAGW